MTLSCQLLCQCFHWQTDLDLFVELLANGLSVYFDLVTLAWVSGWCSGQLQVSELVGLHMVAWAATRLN